MNLTVYDLQGRRIAAPFNHSMLAAGPHSVSLRPTGWPDGFYFCRLDTDGGHATQKFVVLR